VNAEDQALTLFVCEVTMSVEFFIRLAGMLVFAIGGIYLGVYLSRLASGPAQIWASVFAMVGALMGLVITPFLTTRPVRLLRARVRQTSLQTLLAAMIGMIVGLVVAALIAFPMSLLPSPFGSILPFVGALVFGYLGAAVFILRQNDVFGLVRARSGATEPAAGAPDGRSVLLDTSVIIDGRIADVARTGFLPGAMVVPAFVLNELQRIADSGDGLRRQRGRRGLDILNRLQKDNTIAFHISDLDVEGVRNVDDKLVILARQLRAPILTNDYNLNRVAELQGVTVLNINELANAVKAIYIPGESLEVRVIQEGKEAGQGVGYLDDGTMVVVEDGRGFIDRTVPVLVTKVLQTAAGRMIFARPESG
jgi:uncharacterized protein YacL